MQTLYNFCGSIISGSAIPASDSMLIVTEAPEMTDGDGDAVRSVALSTEKGVLIDMLE